MMMAVMFDHIMMNMETDLSRVVLMRMALRVMVMVMAATLMVR